MALEDNARDAGFAVNRISPAMGAEITGLDLNKPLDDATFAILHETMQTHHLLCFRDQHALSDDSQLSFTERWGPLEIFPEADKTKTETTVYHVANVSPDGEHLPEDDPQVVFQKVNARWHTDSSYRHIPSFASIMFGTEVLPDEAEGGETEFSNMLLAYDALSNDMKRRIEPLHMVHYYEFGRRLYPDLPPITAVEREIVPPTCHPLVRVHPDRPSADGKGRRSLFFTTNAGNEVSGMTLEDGQTFHEQIAAHADKPEFCYRHRWRLHDLVMWDNRVLLHRARPYEMAKHRRVFRRTTVAGAGPIKGPYSVSQN
jgi:alpha-ketoglutarate-dependent taurine dioxygenase